MPSGVCQTRLSGLSPPRSSLASFCQAATSARSLGFCSLTPRRLPEETGPPPQGSAPELVFRLLIALELPEDRRLAVLQGPGVDLGRRPAPALPLRALCDER